MQADLSLCQSHIPYCWKSLVAAHIFVFFINLQIEELIEQWDQKGQPVVGVIIEPIQAEGGDKFASPEFFQQLRNITNKVSLLSCFIVQCISFITPHYCKIGNFREKFIFANSV